MIDYKIIFILLVACLVETKVKNTKAGYKHQYVSGNCLNKSTTNYKMFNISTK